MFYISLISIEFLSHVRVIIYQYSPKCEGNTSLGHTTRLSIAVI